MSSADAAAYGAHTGDAEAGKLLDGVHKEAVELESRTNRRQFGAIRIELGNLRLCRTAWWARGLELPTKRL